MIEYVVRKPFRAVNKKNVRIVYKPHERIKIDGNTPEHLLSRLNWAIRWRFIVPTKKTVKQEKKDAIKADGRTKKEAEKEAEKNKAEELKTLKDELEVIEKNHKKYSKELEDYNKAKEKNKVPKMSEEEAQQLGEGLVGLENSITEIKKQIEETEKK